jgi:hypothetical protein
METYYQRIDQNGVSIPLEIIQHIGLKQGTGVRIELQRNVIRILPAEVDVEEIENRALQYLLRNVGDAVVIETPQRSLNGDWLVQVLAGEAGEPLGEVYFSPTGDLISEKSTSLLALRGGPRAA